VQEGQNPWIWDSSRPFESASCQGSPLGCPGGLSCAGFPWILQKGPPAPRPNNGQRNPEDACRSRLLATCRATSGLQNRIGRSHLKFAGTEGHQKIPDDETARSFFQDDESPAGRMRPATSSPSLCGRPPPRPLTWNRAISKPAWQSAPQTPHFQPPPKLKQAISPGPGLLACWPEFRTSTTCNCGSGGSRWHAQTPALKSLLKSSRGPRPAHWRCEKKACFEIRLSRSAAARKVAP